MFLVDFSSDICEELDCNICEFLDIFIQKFNLQPLSVRTKNILLSNKISRLSEFLSMNRFSILCLRNCGRKSCNEILQVKSVVENFFAETQVDEINRLFGEVKTGKPLNTQKNIYEELDCNICEFLDTFIKKFNLRPLSVRAKNVLLNEKINRLSEFLSMDESSILRLRNCGRKSCNEILQVKSVVKNFFAETQVDEINKCYYDAEDGEALNIQKIPTKYKSLDLLCINFSNRLHNALVNNNIFTIENLLSYTENDLLRLPKMGKTCINELNRFLNKKKIKLGMDFEWDDNISIQNDTMEAFFNEIKEFVQGQNEKFSAIFNLRLSQSNIMTLQDVGKLLDLSRERVRQIEKKLLRNLSRIFRTNKEIYDNDLSIYGPIISFDENSALNKYGDFKWILINAFAHNVDRDYIVDYERKFLLREMNISAILNQCCWYKQEFTLSEIEASIGNILKEKLNILEQTNYNLVKEQILKEVLARQFIFCDDNKYILNINDKKDLYQHNKKRKYFSASKIQHSLKSDDIYKVNKTKIKNDIFMRFVCNYCQKPHCLDEIYKEYNSYLSNQSTNWAKEYFFEYNTFYNKLQKNDNLLSSPGKVFRYACFTEDDIIKILQIINLEQYADVEISTLHIFRQHVELLQEYNIKDEYELHNFIKKFYKSDNVDVSRTPIIKFGNASRKQQVWDVLYSISPASKKELASAYEERYGIKENVFITNYITFLADYNKNGRYSCDIEKIEDDDFGNLRKIFTDDFYSLNDVKNKLFQYFGRNADEYVNNYNINRLGYNLSASIIYKNKYQSVKHLVNSIIEDNPILNLSFFPGLFDLGIAYNILQKRKQAFDLIEFTQNKFVNIKLLNEKGVAKADLYEFLKEVESHTAHKFFTLSSIYNENFSFPKLDNLGFDDLFFISLLSYSKKFNIKKINGAFLIRNSSESIEIKEFIEEIVSHKRKINIYELIDYVYSVYNIAVDKHLIISSCAISNELYYNDIMEKVYINYDEYLGDL